MDKLWNIYFNTGWGWYYLLLWSVFVMVVWIGLFHFILPITQLHTGLRKNTLTPLKFVKLQDKASKFYTNFYYYIQGVLFVLALLYVIYSEHTLENFYLIVTMLGSNLGLVLTMLAGVFVFLYTAILCLDYFFFQLSYEDYKKSWGLDQTPSPTNANDTRDGKHTSEDKTSSDGKPLSEGKKHPKKVQRVELDEKMEGLGRIYDSKPTLARLKYKQSTRLILYLYWCLYVLELGILTYIPVVSLIEVLKRIG